VDNVVDTSSRANVCEENM